MTLSWPLILHFVVTLKWGEQQRETKKTAKQQPSNYLQHTRNTCIINIYIR